MADILLAENDGRTWLVTGEQYIDDLLAGTLPSHVTVEFVTCETYSDVDRLWSQGATVGGDAPWLINPAIVERIRGVTERSVVFAQWSAQLDENGRAIIRRCAETTAELPSAEVVLVSYLASDGAALQTDLANLRSAVIEAELTSLGVSPSCISRASREVTSSQTAATETQRIDILLNR